MSRASFMLEDDEQDEFEIKFTILGDSSVGKTNLLLRFIENRFEASSAPTIGFDYLFKRIEMVYKKNIKGLVVEEKEPLLLKIFDTAGQERFRSLTKTHFQGTQGFVLVYDITRRATFENIKGWYNMIQENKTKNTSSKYLLIGNKTDLTNDRQVTEEEGGNFAKQFEMMFMETSAKTNDENKVEVAFNNFIETVIDEMRSDILIGKMARERKKKRLLTGVDGQAPGNNAKKSWKCC